MVACPGYILERTKGIAFYKLSAFGELPAILLFESRLRTVYLSLSTIVETCTRAQFHNTLIRLRFNPIRFMQNYKYFKQCYQECLKQNI